MISPEKFWDLLANNFDRDAGNVSDRHNFKITSNYLRTSDVVLDYACGTGTLAIEIAGHVKEVHAVDISSRMLAAAQTKAEARKIKNIVFTQTTLFDERFQPETFDVILAFNILHLLEDPREAVSRINELLKAGGFFISSTPCLGDKKSLLNRILAPLFVVPSRIGIIPYVHLFKVSELEDLIGRESFQAIETNVISGGLSELFIVSRK